MTLVCCFIYSSTHGHFEIVHHLRALGKHAHAFVLHLRPSIRQLPLSQAYSCPSLPFVYTLLYALRDDTSTDMLNYILCFAPWRWQYPSASPYTRPLRLLAKKRHGSHIEALV